METKDVIRALDEMQARTDILKKACGYARHWPGCSFSRGKTPCDCGWDKLSPKVSAALYGDDSVRDDGKGLSIDELRALTH